MSEKSHQYHLKTGEAGEKQLDNLDRFFGKESHEFLNYIGLRKGMRVLDVGCGIGNLSCWLAMQVGNSGHVVGVDSSKEQIKVAARRAKEKGISNVTFEQVDANDLSKFKDQFDLVYCRALLEHVRNPEAVVNNMANAVHSQGIFACEVGDLGSSFYSPPFPRYVYLRDRIAEILKKSGNDINIFANIVKICKALKNFTFNAKLSQRIIYDAAEAKTFTVNFSLLLDSMSEAFIQNKLMIKKDIDQLRTELQTHPIDENTVIFVARITQVWCQRLK